MFTVAKQLVKRQIYVRHKILVGTHHKTGTVWMKNIFSQLAGRMGLRFVEIGRLDAMPPHGWDILQHDDSLFDLSRLENYRGLHMIRDPRDQIVSAALYHQTSREAWLHVPSPEFGGLTYQQKICSYPSLDDQLLFEMEHSSRGVITEMANFDDGNPHFLTVKYEELVTDRSLQKFEQIFEFLGFRDIGMGWCLTTAYRSSLFSGAVKSRHVRSGNPKQWPDYFKAIHKQRFHSLFGDVLARLGYDEGDEWQSLSCTRCQAAHHAARECGSGPSPAPGAGEC